MLNYIGKVGPVPEGMSAVTALKSLELDRMHKRLKQEVLAAAILFAKKNGYRPPYWDLVRSAESVYKQQGEHCFTPVGPRQPIEMV